MAQWLRMHTALEKDSSSFPSSHVEQFIATYDPAPAYLVSFFDLCWHLHTPVHFHSPQHTYTHK